MNHKIYWDTGPGQDENIGTVIRPRSDGTLEIIGTLRPIEVFVCFECETRYETSERDCPCQLIDSPGTIESVGQGYRCLLKCVEPILLPNDLQDHWSRYHRPCGCHLEPHP